MNGNTLNSEVGQIPKYYAVLDFTKFLCTMPVILYHTSLIMLSTSTMYYYR